MHWIASAEQAIAPVALEQRLWAAATSSALIVNGFVLDDERLNPPDQPFNANAGSGGNHCCMRRE